MSEKSAGANHDQILSAIAAATPPRPNQIRPIVVIGAGGIVRTAHLPAYEKAGYPVIGLMDRNLATSHELASEHRIRRTFVTVAEAVQFAPPDTVFDVAVPASQLRFVLPELPDRSTVLMQKPMGETLAEAQLLRELCRKKKLNAAINFTLRYSPTNLAVVALASAGFLGDIHDLQVQTSTYTPWHLWTFLASAPRLEILYHSIHYFDLIRSWLGDPQSVYARTVRNPLSGKLAATKTLAILDYGGGKRVFVATNHGHQFGPAHQHSFVQWEGITAAARISMGLNLDYPSAHPIPWSMRNAETPRRPGAPFQFTETTYLRASSERWARSRRSRKAPPQHFRRISKTASRRWRWWRRSTSPASAQAKAFRLASSDSHGPNENI